MTIARQQRVGIAWCTAGSWAIRYCEIADSVPFLGLERTLKAIEPGLILTASNASDELKAMLLRVGAPAAAGTPPSEAHEFDAFPSEKLLLTGCRGSGSPEFMTGPNPLVFVRAEELTPERVNATIRVWRNIERPGACRGLTVDSRLPAVRANTEPLDEQGPVARTCVAALLSFLTTRCGLELQDIRAEPFHPDHLGIAPMSLLQELRVLPQRRPETKGHVSDHSNILTLLHMIGGFATSTAGQRKTREVLVQPLCDPERINRRLDVIQAFMDALNGLDLATIKRLLRTIHDPQRHWRRLVAGAATTEDWRALRTSTLAMAELFGGFPALIQQALLTWNAPTPYSHEVNDETALVLEPDWYASTAARIEACIDLDTSTASWQPSVKNGFDESLDSMRLALASLDAFLDSVAVSEKTQFFQSSTTEHSLRVLFYPRMGYVIQIPRTDAAQLELDGSIEQVLETNTDVFLKNDRMRQLDEELGDLPGAIADLEKHIIRGLEAATIPTMPALCRACDLIAELDCWLAFAQAALRFGWARPEIHDRASDIHIDIVNGRHPIVELTIESFVPNTITLKRGDVCVVTGPNASGKSVFLRQIAIVAHMAQVGSFVPAQEARIGVTDRIFTRVKSFDSTGNERSTFMNDCVQMAQLLRYSTPVSLAIIDEFGKGTSDEDGRALAAATLHELSTSVSRHTTVLFATHFHEVTKALCAQLPTNSRIRFFSLKVLIHEADLGNEAPSQAYGVRLTPLYKLAEGSLCQDSYAIACARSNGMPQCILSRAFEIRRFLHARHEAEEAASESVPILCIPTGETWLGRRRERLSKIVHKLAEVASALNESKNSSKDPRILDEVQHLLQMVGCGSI